MNSPEQTYALIAQISGDACALLDENRVVKQADERMYALFGKQIFGYPMERFIRSPDFLTAFESAQADGKTAIIEYTRISPTRREYKLRLLPLGDGLVLLLVRDKTDRLAVNRVRSDFVANVSHELRSPLSVLSGFIETLLDGAAEDEADRNHFLGIMQTEAARMQRLIDDLLSLSRVESEEHRAPRDAVDLVSLLEQVISLNAQQAATRGIELQLQLQEVAADEARIIGNADELQQVFTNLIENAIRYGDADTPLQIIVSFGRQTPSGAKVEDLMRVQVVNQGPVIAEEHIARLTERFYRIDKGRSREIGGTGLGLAIVKHIINKHRGRLRITSDAQGTVFSVTLCRVANH